MSFMNNTRFVALALVIGSTGCVTFVNGKPPQSWDPARIEAGADGCPDLSGTYEEAQTREVANILLRPNSMDDLPKPAARLVITQADAGRMELSYSDLNRDTARQSSLSAQAGDFTCESGRMLSSTGYGPQLTMHTIPFFGFSVGWFEVARTPAATIVVHRTLYFFGTLGTFLPAAGRASTWIELSSSSAAPREPAPGLLP